MRLREAAFVVPAVTALVLSVLACLNVATPDGETGLRNSWRVLVRGPLAGRDAFTARGWRFRNAALAAGGLAALALLFA